MTIGEIKIQALKLMFTNYSNDIQADNIDDLISNDNYGSYLVNMSGSINRAISRINNSGVLRSKAYSVDYSTESEHIVVGEYITKYDLQELIADYHSLDRVIKEGLYGEYNGRIAYNLEEDTLLLSPLIDGESYRLMYKPQIAQISYDSDDTLEFDAPNDIANIIPLFIKGDLFEEDEPQLATKARNEFEQSLVSLMREPVSNQTQVETTYNMGDM